MKILAVMTFAAATALATVPATAESHARGGQGGPAAMLSEDDRAALADARIAAIRAGLRLTEEQEALFAPVAEAMRAVSHNLGPRGAGMRQEMGRATDQEARDEMRQQRREAMRAMSAEERQERRAEMREMRRDRNGLDFMDRLERRSAVASADAAMMSDLTQALRPFWDALEADQQRLLPILMQPDMAMGQHRHARSGHIGERGRASMRGRGASE